MTNSVNNWAVVGGMLMSQMSLKTSESKPVEWKRSLTTTQLLFSACNLYFRKNNTKRPMSLCKDTIMKRNRKPRADASSATKHSAVSGWLHRWSHHFRIDLSFVIYRLFRFLLTGAHLLWWNFDSLQHTCFWKRKGKYSCIICMYFCMSWLVTP